MLLYETLYVSTDFLVGRTSSYGVQAPRLRDLPTVVRKQSTFAIPQQDGLNVFERTGVGTTIGTAHHFAVSTQADAPFCSCASELHRATRTVSRLVKLPGTAVS